MTGPSDNARFEAVLDELRLLFSDFAKIGVGVILVGGQVIAVEALAGGSDGTIEVRTPTGVVVQRGYSLEPDLLFDVDQAGPRADAIVDVLKEREFKRVRTHRWRKVVATGDVLLDLFMPPDADESNNPAGFVRLPAGDLALARAKPLRVQLPSGVLEVGVPDPVAFLAMELEAKLRLRPAETKDSFDIYAYAAMKGAALVGRALAEDQREGARLASELARLFGDVDRPGVHDVLIYAATLEEHERALLARAVVDLFAEILTSRR